MGQERTSLKVKMAELRDIHNGLPIRSREIGHQLLKFWTRTTEIDSRIRSMH